MASLKARPVAWIKDLVISEVQCGSSHTPRCGSYGAYTLTTATGTYVLWTAFGEINLSEVVE